MNYSSDTMRAQTYPPLSFLREFSVTGEQWLESIHQQYQHGNLQCFSLNDKIALYYQLLPWDTDFFGFPIFKIHFLSWTQDTSRAMIEDALISLRQQLAQDHAKFYAFAEIPCEDTTAISSLTGTGWRLIETRVTYANTQLQNFSYPRRSAIRKATLQDIPTLRETAMHTVNPYDRFHADDFFSPDQANAMLASFAENSVKGFADEVIVPADGVANAFLTGNYLLAPENSLAKQPMARMVLSAVAQERKGWYAKLIAEMSYLFKDQGIDTAMMTTQATNHEVIRVWEKMGYHFGKCTHVFSYHP